MHYGNQVVRAVVRALASHQCGTGSNPGVDAISRLSLFLLQGIFAGSSNFFSPSKKKNISKIQFDLEAVEEEPLHGYATANSHIFYFYLFLMYDVMKLLDDLNVCQVMLKHEKILITCYSKVFVIFEICRHSCGIQSGTYWSWWKYECALLLQRLSASNS